MTLYLFVRRINLKVISFGLLVVWVLCGILWGAQAEVEIGGWKTRAWTGGENVQWGVESPGRNDEQCLGISSQKGADAAWTAIVTVKPDTFYKLSGWIRTEDVRGATGALFNIQNMQHVRTPAVTGTRDWTYVSTIFVSGETIKLEINCLFGGWGMSTGRAWYDDVKIGPANLPDPLIASVTVHPDAKTKPYSRMIFGGFLEHFGRQIYSGVFDPYSSLSDENGFRRDAVEALKELNVPVVRWPGGCFASGYHWEMGVGSERKPVDDMAWGVIEPNTFGTDEFVKLSRLAGWEPFICSNAGNGTIEEMRNWVEYCNGETGEYARKRRENGHEEPMNVKYWSIGNENWGAWEIGSKPIEEWAPFVREAAIEMKTVDPDIKLTVAATAAREWTLPLLMEAGPYLDYISIHKYWLRLWSSDEMPDYLTCIMESEGPEELVRMCIEVLEESGYRGRIKLAFDEWNLRAWHHPGFPRKTVQNYDDPKVKELVAARKKNLIASQYTMADALFSASFLNACLRHAEDVGMANIAPLVNTRGPLHVYLDGIVKRPHFHALAMYSNMLGDRVVDADVEAGPLVHGNRFIPVVDAVVTADNAGESWTIALINRHPADEVTCMVKIRDKKLDGKYNATILAGDSPNAFNTLLHPDRVNPVKMELAFKNGVCKLPPHSLTMMQISQ